MAIMLTTGGEATGKGFYEGRRPYIIELQEKVNNSKENLILILGARRIGKTSIVKQYFLERNDDYQDPGVYIYIYIPKIESLADFYQKAIEEIEKALKENSGRKKFQRLLAGSTLKKAINAVQDKIGKVSISHFGIEFKDADEKKRYLSLISSFQTEFVGLIKAFEANRVVLGFDEVPEAIQCLIKNPGGKEEVDRWLEHFREMRHAGGLEDVLKLILFGSVNMKLTLERLGQSKLVNDNFNVTVGPLDQAQSKELFWDLVDTLKLKVLQDHKDQVNSFIDKMFTSSSPWAIQNFLDKFRSPTGAANEKSLTESLQKAYLDLFDIIGGVRYVSERLERYYDKDEEAVIKSLLKYIAKRQVDDLAQAVSDHELFDFAKKSLKVERERFSNLVDILLLDNMVFREGTGYTIKNTVEKNFWYHRLVDSCKF